MKENLSYTYSDAYGTAITVYPEIGIYQDDNNIYLGLSAFDPDIDCIDHYGDVTVNIFPLPYLESAIDTNNNGQKILDFLTANDFGELTGQMIPSGFCWYPIFRFSEDRLREIDPEVFEDYARAHGRQPHPTLDTQITSARATKQPSTEHAANRKKDIEQEH